MDVLNCIQFAPKIVEVEEWSGSCEQRLIKSTGSYFSELLNYQRVNFLSLLIHPVCMDKPSSACGCARWFFSGFSRFRPPTDWPVSYELK